MQQAKRNNAVGCIQPMDHSLVTSAVKQHLPHLKKGWYYASAFGACSCKTHSAHSCNLNLRRLPPSGNQSVTQWAKQGLTRIQECLLRQRQRSEQTWLHLNLSRKAFSLHSTQ